MSEKSVVVVVVFAMKNGILYYSKNNYRWIVVAEKHLASNKLHALYCSKNLLQNLRQKYAFLRLEKRVIPQKMDIKYSMPYFDDELIIKDSNWQVIVKQAQTVLTNWNQIQPLLSQL